MAVWSHSVFIKRWRVYGNPKLGEGADSPIILMIYACKQSITLLVNQRVTTQKINHAEAMMHLLAVSSQLHLLALRVM
eukprot:scaffold227653_cov29-Prasinocladus_malaysianus.AAC.1